LLLLLLLLGRALLLCCLHQGQQLRQRRLHARWQPLDALRPQHASLA
jgi:hypothetical protein